MKRFFKHVAESELGEGTVYIEIADDWPSRQVEVYENAWRVADEQHDEWLADQPISELGLEAEDEIGSSEFEAIWSEAVKRCPQFS